MNIFVLHIFAFTIGSIAAMEFRTNDRNLYMFTTDPGNVHDNYALCSKFGMKLISINNAADETTVRGKQNEQLNWVWIESTFRTIKKTDCPSNCCSLQMEAENEFADASYRVQSCTDKSAYMACQQVYDNRSVYMPYAISSFFSRSMISP